MQFIIWNNGARGLYFSDSPANARRDKRRMTTDRLKNVWLNRVLTPFIRLVIPIEYAYPYICYS
jgi:hypothetical protein